MNCTLPPSANSQLESLRRCEAWRKMASGSLSVRNVFSLGTVLRSKFDVPNTLTLQLGNEGLSVSWREINALASERGLVLRVFVAQIILTSGLPRLGSSSRAPSGSRSAIKNFIHLR